MEPEDPPWREELSDLRRKLQQWRYRFTEEDGWLILRAIREGYEQQFLEMVLNLKSVEFRSRMGSWVMRHGVLHHPSCKRPVRIPMSDKWKKARRKS